MLWTFLQSSSFIPLKSSEKIDFDFFHKFSLLVAMATNQISGLDKIHMLGRGLLKEYFCKTFVKTSAVR